MEFQVPGWALGSLGGISGPWMGFRVPPIPSHDWKCCQRKSSLSKTNLVLLSQASPAGFKATSAVTEGPIWRVTLTQISSLSSRLWLLTNFNFTHWAANAATLKQALEKTQPWGHHSHAKAPRFYHCFYISDSHLNFRFLCFPHSCFIHANHRNCPQNLERKLDWSGIHTSNNGQFL